MGKQRRHFTSEDKVQAQGTLKSDHVRWINMCDDMIKSWAKFERYFASREKRMRRFLQRSVAYPIGKMRGNAIETFWGFNNFGDLITPILLREIGYTPVRSKSINSSQLLFVGSILDNICDDFDGVILGSGFLNKETAQRVDRATVLGLRGELSKKQLGLTENLQLGDCGLLLPKFFKEKPKPKYKIGIIPHYVDANDARVHRWITRFREAANVINVNQDPRAVFYQVCSCEYIVSSSLHGLVVADSLGIANLWICLSDLCGHGTHKFIDYYSAFNVNRSPYNPNGNETIDELIGMTVKPPDAVPDVIEKLYDIFLSLPRYIAKVN